MIHKNGSYERILESIKEIPVIDCHEHQALPADQTTPKEPISFLIRGYFGSDLVSAGMSQSELQLIQDKKISTEKKWKVFKRYWSLTEHTAYAREVKDIMHSYGEDTISLRSLKRFGDKITELSGEKYLNYINSLNIKALLVNILDGPATLKSYIQGKIKMPECYKLLIPLPSLHLFKSYQEIQNIASILEVTVTCLDEFLDVVRDIMKRFKSRGAVGIKDQSAYIRSLDFKPSTKAEAEHLFNKCLANPNDSLGWPEAKPLDDFLFHEYMRFARDLDMPVQVHTGHMAGNWNRVNKTNASLFSRVLELHKEVKFDLFHGNWPYMGDLLFLGKNYPNVYLDLCWVNIIDPLYSIELIKRAVLTVPHSKINGFGGDYGVPEVISVHLSLAQRNIAYALSSLVSERWLSENEAVKLAADFLFNNPNKLFKLGFTPYVP
jgi:predicted TIM-barrel fold metal-dependent hydrolase